MDFFVHRLCELLDERALLFVQALGHFDLDRHDLVSRAIATEPWHAFAAQSQLESRLGSGRHAHPDLAFQRRNVDQRAEGRLRKAHGNLALQIASLPREQRVLEDPDAQLEISRNTGARRCVAEAAYGARRAVFDTRGEGHRQPLLLPRQAFPGALCTGHLRERSTTVTATALAHHAHETLLEAHLASPCARRARIDAGPGIGATATTRVARGHPDKLDDLLDALGGLVQGQVYIELEIPPCGATFSETWKSLEEIPDKVLEHLRHVDEVDPWTGPRGPPEAVEVRATVGIAKDVIRLTDFLEPSFGAGIPRVHVWMVLARQPTIGLLDLLGTRRAVDTKGLVVIAKACRAHEAVRRTLRPVRPDGNRAHAERCRAGMLAAMFRCTASLGRFAAIAGMSAVVTACGDHIGFDAGWDVGPHDTGGDIHPADQREAATVSDTTQDSPGDVAADGGIDAARDVTVDVAGDSSRDGPQDTREDSPGSPDARDVAADVPVDARTDVPSDTSVEAGTPWRHTISIDGANDFSAVSESIPTTSLGYTAYVTWDASNLYIGYDGLDIASGSTTRWVFAFLDVNPGATGGATSSPAYNTESVGFSAGFSPDFYLRWRASNDFQSLEQYSAGAWNPSSTAPQTFQMGNFVEFRIPLAALGSPTRIGITTLMLNEASLAEAAYAGLYTDNFANGYYPTIPVTAYLLADLTASVTPNSAANRR